MPRTRLLSLFLLPLCLVLGCSGDDAAGPETSTELEENVEKAVDKIGGEVEKVAEKVTEKVEQVVTGSALDLTYITDDFSSAVIIHPARVLNSEMMKSLVDAGLPLEKALEKPTQEFGIDPRTVEQIIVLVDKSTADMAPMMIPLGGPPGGNPGGFGTPATEPEPLEESPDNGNQGARIDQADELQTVAFQLGDAVAEEEFQEPLPTIIVRFSEAVDADALFDNPNAPPLEDFEIDGLKVKKASNPDGVFYFADPQTLIMTRPEYLKKMLDTKSASSDLITELKNVDATSDVIIVADLTPLKQLLEMGSEFLTGILPPDKAALAAVPTKTKMLSITGGISNDTLISLTLIMESADDVTAISPVLTDGLKEGREMYNQVKAQGLPTNVPLDEEGQKELTRMTDEIVAGTSIAAKGNRLTVTIPKPSNFNGLAALAKQPIEDAKRAAEEAKKKNNLKQIGIAFHNYHDVFNTFPGAGSDAQERKGLSWRVHLLPFLDQAALYDQFNFDEPWDSDHNKALIDQMPDVYKTEGVDDPTKTSVHVFLGDYAFSLDKGKRIAEYKDGTSNSLLVVEAAPDKADIWTKPGGLTLNEDDPLATLGELQAGTFLALFADGSVRSISITIDPETLKALVTINGGEVIGNF